jgi:hypothetical protein
MIKDGSLPRRVMLTSNCFRCGEFLPDKICPSCHADHKTLRQCINCGGPVIEDECLTCEGELSTILQDEEIKDAKMLAAPIYALQYPDGSLMIKSYGGSKPPQVFTFATREEAQEVADKIENLDPDHTPVVALVTGARVGLE